MADKPVVAIHSTEVTEKSVLRTMDAVSAYPEPAEAAVPAIDFEKVELTEEMKAFTPEQIAEAKSALSEQNIATWIKDLTERLNKEGHVKNIDFDVARYYYEKGVSSSEAALAYQEILPEHFEKGEG